MASLSTWIRYAALKLEYTISFSWTKYHVGQINGISLSEAILKGFFQGKLTYAHWIKGGEAMAPIFPATGGTILVRKLPHLMPSAKHGNIALSYGINWVLYLGNSLKEGTCCQDNKAYEEVKTTPLLVGSWQAKWEGGLEKVFVGDIVLLKDPESDDFIVRRLAAMNGYEMASSDEKDEPFVLDNDECWVLADNQSLQPKEARDSRLFGPVPMTDIVGRVVYALRTAVDHGPVDNSRMAMNQDSPVLAVELDVEEMVKNNKM